MITKEIVSSGNSGHVAAVFSLAGVIVGGLIVAGTQLLIAFFAIKRVRKGHVNLLVGLLRNCSVYANTGTKVKLPDERIQQWLKCNDALIAALSLPDVMSSVSPEQSAALWNASLQGTLTVGLISNMRDPNHPWSAFSTTTSSVAFNHYTKARAALGDNITFQKVLDDMSASGGPAALPLTS